MRASLVIPAFNEAESIGAVLSEIPPYTVEEVIVVDGGSHDSTAAIARSHGASVILEPRRGYGLACDAGMRAAVGEIVVFMDADGANDPAKIEILLEPLQAGQADMVLGSRLAGEITKGAMPWHQRTGNWLAASLFRSLYALPITDLAPFRAVDREKLLALDLREMTYGWPTEMIAKAARQGWRIREVPVRYRPRLGGDSKISGTFKGTLLATYFILTTIIRNV